MIKVGQMWIRDNDEFFTRVFQKTGDDFELSHLKEAIALVTQFKQAVDIGANYGSWTRYMASKFDNVLAFEPVEENYKCLVKNTEMLPNVKLVKKAVGEKSQQVAVGIGKMYDNVGMYTVLGDGDIPMVTLDSFELSNVGLIKLDIEGYELFALRGAKDTLVRNKPIVILEDNIRCKLEHGVEQGAAGKFLESLGAKLITNIRSDYIYAWEDNSDT